MLPSTETSTASPVPSVEPLPSEEKPPRDRPTAEVADADRAPELVEAEVLALDCRRSGTRGVHVRRQDDELRAGRDCGSLKRVETKASTAPPADGVTAAASGSRQREDRDGVGALAADQDIEVAVGLGHHLDRAGQRGRLALWPVAPTPRSNRCPAGARIFDDAVGEGHDDLPARQGLRGQTCCPEKTTLAPAAGSSRSNRTRSPPAVTAKPTPLSPANVGGWTTALPRLNSVCGLLVIEEATADAGQQGHGAAAAVDDREIGD